MSASPEAETTGFAFHQEREALHGITVVVTGNAGRTYVGRYHERNNRGVLLKDVAIHTGESELPLEQWVERQRTFGIAVAERVVTVPHAEVAEIRTLIAK